MIDTDKPTVNEPVAFDASASTVEDGKIVAYKWDFTGDGTADRTGQSVEHAFSDRGLHPISLTVVDETGAKDTVQRALSVTPRESDLSIAIVDTNSPVEGGDRLMITVEVTNTGEIAHRPEITAIFNEEKRGGIKTTVEPGKTETHSFGYRTYPVKDEVDIPIHAEIETDTATKTVTVRAVDELESTYTSPSSELTIQPATQVMFEIDTTVMKPEGTIQWYVDGSHHPTQGAVWPFMYADKVGREFFSYLFESPGTHEITAAVVRDDRNRAMRWTITVTDSGAIPPRIDAARPVTSELAADGQYTLELDISSPTTDLDRVVWWMTQADTIIGITEVSSRNDTASLEIDGGCLSCQIEAWAITENNTYTSIIPWQFKDGEDSARNLDKRRGIDVLVLETNSPIVEGEAVKVRAMLENTESTQVTREVELTLGEKPTVVESQTVTMAAGTTDEIVLTSTVPSALKGEWISFRVQSDTHQNDGVIHVEQKNTETHDRITSFTGDRDISNPWPD
ncbi:PKD domain-containing protein [Natrinema sp. SYSU A 869]|uniref:PKD domain-containing protein n=1 Tax=Natrinema sp. SYSU A 869 TaxID=2871694 RepID=UPI001CA3CCD1|nr:PKD domain-containing protein [Natrinema sp. SYSU A 869]